MVSSEPWPSSSPTRSRPCTGNPFPPASPSRLLPPGNGFSHGARLGIVIRFAVLILIASAAFAAQLETRPDENGVAAKAAKAILAAGLEPQECYRVRDLVFNKEDIRF